MQTSFFMKPESLYKNHLSKHNAVRDILKARRTINTKGRVNTGEAQSTTIKLVKIKTIFVKIRGRFWIACEYSTTYTCYKCPVSCFH